ncbi:QacE family quaternary ammonium compound efflux SMR transporter [Helicobacter saguini]|uniref:Guanidinium exporter n=1 Tax=Helicobacter saguini TaxID=1548018 RepID=A0A347VS01_9HELI|nr:SMR family transporter [Helicobacter saguini]MWV62709.1 QacE family quaternary ammonium compound efflux SMR transporter [Helicobacter saguini]MWV66620.1 QacE family quaternary ammonium compound efflux SMR transporter [Helicobacter saguini]MWV68970.1 QacE family quaternary ammonium compound efflux SMR transporter [Helicobacter saguini]MWV71477.1 QacE family quaternary ammonium compound efflux SMR transporter [Helicobacter saguini]TLD94119.1 QacE family quaternary ammonium compound efflux SMR
MSWFFLILAGLMEIVGVITMKKFVETKRKIFILGLIAQFALSFGFLSQAMQGISMGTAYAIWTGIGAGGGVIVGVLFFNESKSLAKFFFLFLILFASVGLKFLS